MQNEIGKPITDVRVKLIGEDGNVFHILSKVSTALRKAGYSQTFIGEYLKQATAGGYDDMLQVTMLYVEVE